MDRLYYETLTVPANTPVASAVSQSVILEDNQLLEVDITIPDGHCGLTGVRILQAQQQIVPFANSSYLIANDRTVKYPFADEITSSGLVIEGYNTDIFSHTFYCTFLITNLPLPGVEPEAEVVTPGSDVTSQDFTTDDLSVDAILNGSNPADEPVTPLVTPSPASPLPALPKSPVKKPGPIRRGEAKREIERASRK